jgi:hypothetical protein
MLARMMVVNPECMRTQIQKHGNIHVAAQIGPFCGWSSTQPRSISLSHWQATEVKNEF